MVAMSEFARTITTNKYAHKKASGNKESWEEIAERQAFNVIKPHFPKLYNRCLRAITERKFIPGGRYLYGVGQKFPQVNNCFLFRAEDSREGWGHIVDSATQALMTGGGIGIAYSLLRERGQIIKGMGGDASGPVALMQMVNEIGRYIRQGGSRRSAIWAGLHWDHPDIFEFIGIKDWEPFYYEQKAKDFNFPAPMDGTNISVILDDDFFVAYRDVKDENHRLAHKVYWTTIESMLRNGEPGFSVDVGSHTGENLRNACTEVTSSDHGDMCNLGSINLARVESLDEFCELLEVGVAFLTAGTVYSKLPLDFMTPVRDKNRRIGLGLMGCHEWLLKRGYQYGPCSELEHWLNAYQMTTELGAKYADELGIAHPIATRSIAPTGTISIVAETTSGVEPIFSKAFKRRYLDGETWKYQFVVDATAKRLISNGVDIQQVEDAYDLAKDVPRRIEFQSFLQEYVDQGISSTINLPQWGSEGNKEEDIEIFGFDLMQSLPLIRGITAYPDGARGGQPLVPWDLDQALSLQGQEYQELETGDMGCKSGVCYS